MFFSTATRPTYSADRPRQVEELLVAGLEQLDVHAARPAHDVAKAAASSCRCSVGVATIVRAAAQ